MENLSYRFQLPVIISILIQTVLYFSVVRAVSAPREGTTLTGQNNYESNAFCHFDETEQNAGGPSLHRPYNVDVNGTSECAKQKIRTSLFFYELFLNQFQKSNNSYCISKKNFSSGKEKNYPPYIDFVYRKRNLLGIEKESQVKISHSKRSLNFMRIQKPVENPSSSEKKGEQITKLVKVKDKRRKKDLKNVEINDELDINKGIEKLVKQIALENLRTEEPESGTEFAEPSKEFRNHVKEPATVPRDSFPFFKRIFRFNKEYSNKNITNDDTQVGTVPVKIVQGKDPIPVAKARSGSRDVLESLRKRTRFKRNPRKRFFPRYSHVNNAMSRFRSKLNMQSDAFGDDVNNLKNFPYFEKSKKFVPANRRKRRKNRKIRRNRRRNDFRGHVSNNGRRRGAFDSRLKRYDATPSIYNLNKLLKSTSANVMFGSLANPDKLFFYQKNEDETPRPILEESKKKEKNTLGIHINVKIPPHTLEKPTLSDNTVLGKKVKIFKYKLPNDENLTPYRYLKIRHALRNYLIHNEIWAPVRKENLSQKRKKRYGANSTPKKCWKSAPLLCIPYIRKGQDEMLKQIIRSVQRMIEKPTPEKVEIFEKTKFKPCAKKEPDHGGEKNSNTEDYPYQTTSPSHPSKSRVPTEHKHKTHGTHAQACSPTPNHAHPSVPGQCTTCPPCPAQYSNRPPGPTQFPTRPTYRNQGSKGLCNAAKHAKGSGNASKCFKGSPRPAHFSTSTPCLPHSSTSPTKLTQFSTSRSNPLQCPVCLPCPSQFPALSSNQSTACSMHPPTSSLPTSSVTCSTTPLSALCLTMPPPTPCPTKPSSQCATTTPCTTLHTASFSPPTRTSSSFTWNRPVPHSKSSIPNFPTPSTPCAPTTCEPPSTPCAPTPCEPPSTPCAPTTCEPPSTQCVPTSTQCAPTSTPCPTISCATSVTSSSTEFLTTSLASSSTEFLTMSIFTSSSKSMFFPTLPSRTSSQNPSSTTNMRTSKLPQLFTSSSLSSKSPILFTTPLPSTSNSPFSTSFSTSFSTTFSTYASFTTPVFLTTITPFTISKMYSTTTYLPFIATFSAKTRLPFTLATSAFFTNSQSPTVPIPTTCPTTYITSKAFNPTFPTDPTFPPLLPFLPSVQPFGTSTSMALRHFLQELSTISRSNNCCSTDLPFSRYENLQCPIFNNNNMKPITTPMSYFSPTTYFLNSLETENPPFGSTMRAPVLTRTLARHFYSNRSNIQPNPTRSSYTTGNGCTWCFSKQAMEQTEYFSFPELSYTAPPESPKKFAPEGKLQPLPQIFAAKHMPANEDTLLNMKNIVPEWTLTYTLLESTEPSNYVAALRNNSRASHLGKSSENFMNLDKSKLKGMKKMLGSDEDKAGNRNFLSNRLLGYMQDNENLFRKITKARRHRLNSKFHHKPDMELPNYDLYERQPFVRSTEKNTRYQKHPLPWLFHQRAKSHANKRHLKRQKREDNYYSSAENLNYPKENLNDFKYENFHPNDFQPVLPRYSSAENFDSPIENTPETTPLFFALFSELAKAVGRPGTATASPINEANNENITKLPEKRKSSDSNFQNDTTDTTCLTKTIDKGIITETTTICLTETIPEFTTTSTEESTTRSSTLKCKVTARRKKTTIEDSTTSTVPLFSEPITTPFTSVEATTCYCVPVTSTSTTIVKPCRPRKEKTTTATTKIFSSSTEICSTTAVTVEKETEITQPYLDTGDEGQMPTTLKFASIVKGPKKVLMKPSPKTYTKVFPDSLGNDLDSNDGITSPKTDIEKKIPMHVFPISNTRLQLLAVCEGYLEVVKLIKAQNQSIEEGLDADLSRYCENIISQSFSYASDNTLKIKKADLMPTPPMFPEAVKSVKKQRSRFPSKTKLFSKYKPLKELTSQELRDKIVVDILSSPVYKRELAAKIEMKRKKKIKSSPYSQMKPSNKRKFKVRKFKNYHPGSDFSTENPRRFRRKEKPEDELLGRGIPEEQMKLLHLLRKRKRALLSWLFNSKEDQMKPDDMRETEYLDDEEYVTPDAGLKEASGKITPKVDETTSMTKTNETYFADPSMFPVYAKNYGYDRGGELREVEVLWRKVNEKTHQKKIFKNQSVLALLLAPNSPPNAKPKDKKSVRNNIDMSGTRPKGEGRVSFAEPPVLCGKVNTTAAIKILLENSSLVNETQTIISKPDPSSIVGTPPNATTVYPNTTHKVSHALAVAKDLFQEYIIEFLNYAVYILPIMFTLLFLFCCVCCFLQILRNKKNRRKKKQRRKKRETSEDDSDGECSSNSESECKKKVKRKKQDKKKIHTGNLEKKASKTIWSVLRLNSAKPSSEFNDDNSQAEKRSFLWFLKGKKDEGKIEELPYTTLHELDENPGEYENSVGEKSKELNDIDDCELVHQNEDRKKKKEEKIKMDEQTEATERRELIALLEELKKIETEKAEEKKEHKSVYVQYMTQEEDNSFYLKRETRPRQLGKSRGPSFCQKHFPFDEGPAIQNYELYEDVGELTELLPCERNCYSKRNDYLRHSDFRINEGGRCERFFKIFRDSGVTQNKHFREMDFMKSGDRSYIFNKYRTISTGTRDKLLGGTDKNSETEITDTVLPFSLPTKKKIDLVEEMENLKRQLNKKKYVRLKDDGVLCRL